MLREIFIKLTQQNCLIKIFSLGFCTFEKWKCSLFISIKWAFGVTHNQVTPFGLFYLKISMLEFIMNWIEVFSMYKTMKRNFNDFNIFFLSLNKWRKAWQSDFPRNVVREDFDIFDTLNLYSGQMFKCELLLIKSNIFLVCMK